MAKVIEQFNEIPEIKKVFSLTGDYDVVAEIEVESTDELYESFANKIDNIDGIIETNTHVIMKSWEKWVYLTKESLLIIHKRYKNLTFFSKSIISRELYPITRTFYFINCIYRLREILRKVWKIRCQN